MAIKFVVKKKVLKSAEVVPYPMTSKEIKAEKRRIILENRRLLRGPSKSELLALEGRQFVNFAWPIDLWEQIVSLANVAEMKPNDYVLGLLVKHLEAQK